MKNKIKIGCVYGFLALETIIIALIIYFWVGLDLISEPPGFKSDGPKLMSLFLLMVVVAPITEEFFFRWVPIRGIDLITKNKLILWIIIIVSSAGFGILHGSWHNIFIQGVAGIIFSLAFLKGGYLSSVTAHATYNSIIIATIFCLKQI
mgnify:CR=1 FL=1